MATSFAGYNRWVLATFLGLQQDEADAWALAEMRRKEAAAEDAANSDVHPAVANAASPEPRSGAPPD